jgi:hypothetical protein
MQTSQMAPSMPQSSMQQPGMQQMAMQQLAMQQCVQNCKDCHAICMQTIAYCLHKGGQYVHNNLIQSLMDCCQMCLITEDSMLRNSLLHFRACGLCVEACRRCAEYCEQIGSDGAMQECAQLCRRCAECCQQMAMVSA